MDVEERSLSQLSQLIQQQNVLQEQELAANKTQQQTESAENDQINNTLKSIYSILSNLLEFEKSRESSQELQQQLTPKDYEDDLKAQRLVSQETATRESAETNSSGGILESLGLLKIFDVLKKGILGIIEKFGLLATSISPILGKLMELGGGFTSIITAIGGFVAGLSGIQGGFAASVAAGAATGGVPGAIAGAVSWGAGKITNREPNTDKRIGRWDDEGEPGSKIRPSTSVDVGTKELLNRITIGEGTGDEKAKKAGFESGYDVPYGYGQYAKPDKPLSQMTVGEVKEFQKKQIAATRGKVPGTKEGTGAVGKYQVVQGTLEEQQKNLKFKDTDIFNEELQDKIGYGLLKKRGYEDFRKGKISEEEFQENLANEWASVASPHTGKSKYGQGTGTSTKQIKESMAFAKEHREFNTGQNEQKLTKAEEPTQKSAEQLQNTKESLSSRVSHKGVDIKNLNSDYATNLSAFIEDAEKEFGKKLQITSAYRPPTEKEKGELNSVGSTQGGLNKGKMVASTYGSMHGMGVASDVMFKGMTKEQMNEMSSEDKQKWLDIAKKHNLDVPMRPGGAASSVTEWWHVEPKDIERGGASKKGLKDKEYTDYIKNASLEENIRLANKQTYAKVDETELPEGGKYKEEESEIEEVDEPTLSEENIPSTLEDKVNLNEKVGAGYENFFSEMLDQLEKMVSFTEEIKDSNNKMADAETPESETAKREEIQQEPEQTQKIIKEDQLNKELDLTNQKNQVIDKPSQQSSSQQSFFDNTLNNIQNVLGSMGSAIGMGSQIGNSGIGSAIGVNTSQGVLGNISRAAYGIDSVRNMGNMGIGGGIQGGIGAAQGAIGIGQTVLGTMQNIGQSMGGIFGNSFSTTPNKVGTFLGENPKEQESGIMSSIGNSIGEFFNPTPNKVGKFLGENPKEESITGSSVNTTNEFVTPTQNKVGKFLGESPQVSSMGIGSDMASINSKYSMSNDVPSLGGKLESLSKSVESTRQEMMIPPEPAPVVVQGGGGASGGGGGASASDNPPSSGTMGIDIGVRNEEPTLMRAQYGSIRVV